MIDTKQIIWNNAVELLINTHAFDCEPSGVYIDNRIIKLVVQLLETIEAHQKRIVAEKVGLDEKLEKLNVFKQGVKCVNPES